MSGHYFAPSPEGDDRRRELTVDLDGPLDVTTAAGVFSADGLDHATAILLDTVPRRPSTQRLLDLGCGWGAIALSAAASLPGTEVWAVDVNERARELTRLNAERHELTIRVAAPEEVPAEVTFDAIWSNPPIRIGKEALHGLLLRWLSRLGDGGEMVMVVGKNLGADSLQRWLNGQGWPTERLASTKGFRILRTTRARHAGGR